MSLILASVFTLMVLRKTIDLYEKDSELYMIKVKSTKAPIDLYELGYMFAIEDIDPKIGRIMVEQINIKNDEDLGSQDETRE